MPISPSLRGLSQAVSTGPTGFDPATDPLGIALQGRARDARQQQELANPKMMTAGPLPDPQWEGFFQAVHEAGDGRPTTYAGSTGEDLGYDTNNGTTDAGTELYGPRGMTWNRTSPARSVK